MCTKHSSFVIRHSNISPTRRKRPTPIYPSHLKVLLSDLPFSNDLLILLIIFILSTDSAYTIILIAFSPIRNTNIPDLVPNLHPSLTAARNRANLAQDPVCQARDDETGEEVDIVDVNGTLRYRLSNGSNESDNVDKDTADIGCVSAPVEAEGKVVGCRFAGGVEVPYLVVATADDVIIADNDAGNRREEDRIG